MTGGSRITLTIFISPPHSRQTSESTSKTRRTSVAQARRFSPALGRGETVGLVGGVGCAGSRLQLGCAAFGAAPAGRVRGVAVGVAAVQPGLGDMDEQARDEAQVVEMVLAPRLAALGLERAGQRSRPHPPAESTPSWTRPVGGRACTRAWTSSASRSRPSCRTPARPTTPPCWRAREPDRPEGLPEAAAGRVAHRGDHPRDRPPLRHQARRAGRREPPRAPAPPPRPRPRETDGSQAGPTPALAAAGTPRASITEPVRASLLSRSTPRRRIRAERGEP